MTPAFLLCLCPLPILISLLKSAQREFSKALSLSKILDATIDVVRRGENDVDVWIEKQGKGDSVNSRSVVERRHKVSCGWKLAAGQNLQRFPKLEEKCILRKSDAVDVSTCISDVKTAVWIGTRHLNAVMVEVCGCDQA